MQNGVGRQVGNGPAPKAEEKNVALEVCKQRLLKLIKEKADLTKDQQNLEEILYDLFDEPKYLVNVTSWIDAVFRHKKFNQLTPQAKAFLVLRAKSNIVFIDAIKGREQWYKENPIAVGANLVLTLLVEDFVGLPPKGPEAKGSQPVKINGADEKDAKAAGTPQTPQKKSFFDFLKLKKTTPPSTPHSRKDSDNPAEQKSFEENVRYIFYKIVHSIAAEAITLGDKSIPWQQYQAFISSFFKPQEVETLREFFLCEFQNEQNKTFYVADPAERQYLCNLLLSNAFPMSVSNLRSNTVQAVIHAINQKFIEQLAIKGALKYVLSHLMAHITPPVKVEIREGEKRKDRIERIFGLKGSLKFVIHHLMTTSTPNEIAAITEYDDKQGKHAFRKLALILIIMERRGEAQEEFFAKEVRKLVDQQMKEFVATANKQKEKPKSDPGKSPVVESKQLSAQLFLSEPGVIAKGRPGGGKRANGSPSSHRGSSKWPPPLSSRAQVSSSTQVKPAVRLPNAGELYQLLASGKNVPLEENEPEVKEVKRTQASAPVEEGWEVLEIQETPSSIPDSNASGASTQKQKSPEKLAEEELEDSEDSEDDQSSELEPFERAVLMICDANYKSKAERQALEGIMLDIFHETQGIVRDVFLETQGFDFTSCINALFQHPKFGQLTDKAKAVLVYNIKFILNDDECLTQEVQLVASQKGSASEVKKTQIAIQDVKQDGPMTQRNHPEDEVRILFYVALYSILYKPSANGITVLVYNIKFILNDDECLTQEVQLVASQKGSASEVKKTQIAIQDVKQEGPMTQRSHPEDEVTLHFSRALYSILYKPSAHGITLEQYQEFIKKFIPDEKLEKMIDGFMQRLSTDGSKVYLKDVVHRNFVANLLLKRVFPIAIQDGYPPEVIKVIRIINKEFTQQILAKGVLKNVASLLITGCELVLMPTPLGKDADARKNSKQNKLYLYNENGKFVYYINGKPQTINKQLIPGKLEFKDYPVVCGAAVPAPAETAVANDFHVCSAVLAITSGRGHTLSAALSGVLTHNEKSVIYDYCKEVRSLSKLAMILIMMKCHNNGLEQFTQELQKLIVFKIKEFSLAQSKKEEKAKKEEKGSPGKSPAGQQQVRRVAPAEHKKPASESPVGQQTPSLPGGAIQGSPLGGRMPSAPVVASSHRVESRPPPVRKEAKDEEEIGPLFDVPLGPPPAETLPAAERPPPYQPG